MDFELNEYQKKKITDRLKLNFNEELNKKDSAKIHFSKNFRKELDIFITELYDNGVMFYGFEIPLSFLDQNESNFWYLIHCNVESLIDIFRREIELIEFCYFSIELSKLNIDDFSIVNESKQLVVYNEKKNIPHLLGIFGVRSLSGKNILHFNEMKKVFTFYQSDYVLKSLTDIEVIKNYWYFVIKQNNFKFHRFTQYSEFFNNLYGSISDLELQYENHIAFGLDETYDAKYRNLSGVLDFDPNFFVKINYIVTLFMNEKKYVLYNNFIFKKNINSVFSWEIVSSINFLNENNLQIFNDIKYKYPQQLKYLKISNFLINSWDNFYICIKKHNNYLPGISFNKNIIEFLDGIYFYDDNKFYDFSEINKEITNINTLNFFSKKFKEIKSPKRWLKVVGDNVFSLEKFCISLGVVFHEVFNVDEKENYLFGIILNECLKKKHKKILEIALLREDIFKDEMAEIIIYCNNLYNIHKNF